MTGIIVPLYVYPAPGAWDAVVAAKRAHPSVPFLVVANPDSGVGQSLNQDYLGGIRYLRNNGCIILGYVDTAYGNRNVTQVMAEMDQWKAWYPIDGYFFDDVASSGQESYLQTLKSHAGVRFCVGNPGTSAIPQSYFGILDNLCVEGAGLPTIGGMAGISAICHSIPAFLTPPSGFDFVFETDRLGPPARQDTYNYMSPYLNQLAAALEKPMSAPQRCRYVVVHNGGQPIGQIAAEVPFLQPFNIDDARRGIGYGAIQSNSIVRTPDGKDHGVQNILVLEPGKLSWRVEMPVSSGTGSLPSDISWTDDILKLNQQSLGTIVNTVRFSIVNQGNRVYVSLMLKDLNGFEVKYIEQDLPGKYVGDILSSYVVGPCGWGDGTQANLDQSFSTKIVYEADSALQVSAWNKEMPPVPFCLTNENNNLYQIQQDLEGKQPNEVSVVTAYGNSD